MNTTIQISKKLKEELKNMKLHNNESYEDIIWDLLEDRKVLSTETLKNISKAQKEIENGKFITHDALKKKLGI